MKRVINLSLLGLLLVMSCNEREQVKIGHQCNWEDCELVGQTSFHSTWGYDSLTDGWCLELTHFEHPDWSYEKCDHWIMCGNDYFEHHKSCTCDFCMEWTNDHTLDYTIIQGLDSTIVLDAQLDTISKYLTDYE